MKDTLCFLFRMLCITALIISGGIFIVFDCHVVGGSLTGAGVTFMWIWGIR